MVLKGTTRGEGGSDAPDLRGQVTTLTFPPFQNYGRLWNVLAPRLISPLCALVVALGVASVLACAGGPAGQGSEGEGEGEGGGEGEGEGEGEGDAVSFEFERADGTAIDDALLDLGTVDAGSAALAVDLAIKNTGAADFAILTDPPLLVAGRDAARFTVTTQPADVVPAGQAVPFTLQYDPASPGQHEGKLLFAYGVRTEDRAVLTVEAVAQGDANSGVHYAIYDGAFADLPDFSTLTPAETGVLPTFDISQRAGTDNFAFTFDGFVVADAEGNYVFYTTSDDGSRLSIDGALVVDNGGSHAAQEVSGAVDLGAGPHAIHLEYFEGGGGESLVVEWEGPGLAREEVPADHLFLESP